MLLTPDEMATVDRASIAAGVAGVDLMEAAGFAVAQAVASRWQPCPVLVLCGPGNNGGDGFVVARLLSDLGWPVRVASLGPVPQTGDAGHHAQLWDGPIESFDTGLLEDDGVVIDAIFGAGLSRPVEGPALEMIEAMKDARSRICAIDVPSGLDGATGSVLGGAAPAELTVTFVRKKPGHLLLPGRALCGHLVLADIGTPSLALEAVTARTWENAPSLWEREGRRVLLDGNTSPPVILDADALGSLAANPDAMFDAIPESSVLALFDDQFDRLFDITGDQLTRARRGAARSGAVVLLSGYDTVIAHPDGRAVINTNGPPEPGSSGAQDVIPGIEEMLSRGLGTFEAACAAAWLYGDAASGS